MGESTPSNSLPPGNARFRALDSWRGIFALAVAAYHLPVNSHFYTSGLRVNSYLFVDFFFVLSGFVISHVYASSVKTRRDAVGFIVRRIGRVWPLHVTVLAFFVMFEAARWLGTYVGVTRGPVPFGTEETSALAIATNVFLIHSLNIHETLTWNHPSWSISVEVFVYILFVILVAISGRYFIAAAIASMVAGGAILIAVAATPDTTYDYGVFRCMYGFFLGSIVRLIFPFYTPSKSALQLLEAAALVCVVAFVWTAGSKSSALLAPLLFGLTVWVFAHEAGPVSRGLKLKPFQHLGSVSYSIYMVHMVVLAIPIERGLKLAQAFYDEPIRKEMYFRWSKQGLLIFDFASPGVMDLLLLIYLIMVVSLATLTHRWIEIPGQAWFAKLGGRVSSVSGRVSTKEERDDAVLCKLGAVSRFNRGPRRSVTRSS